MESCKKCQNKKHRCKKEKISTVQYVPDEEDIKKDISNLLAQIKEKKGFA